MSAVVLMAALMAQVTPMADATWAKVMMTDAAANDGAVCLDGSPGGYFIQRGDPKKWVVFHQGGGWCTNPQDCAARAYGTNNNSHPWLGGSKAWPSTYVDRYEASQLFASPTFKGFTLVYALYCDGGSWTGDLANPINTSFGKLVFYRGRRLLDAMLADWRHKGLAQADELLYAGCSAGALTAYLHADYVASQLPASVKVRALGDAMYDIDTEGINGFAPFVGQLKDAFGEWNASGSIPPACLARHGPDDGWKCLFGAALLPVIKTPTFILNSKYDTFQAAAIVGYGPGVVGANATVTASFVAYGKQMVAGVSGLPARHGAFMSNCPAHCQTGYVCKATGYAWGNTSIKGTSIGEAVTAWYTAGAVDDNTNPATASTRHFASCELGPWANASCPADNCAC